MIGTDEKLSRLFGLETRNMKLLSRDQTNYNYIWDF